MNAQALIRKAFAPSAQNAVIGAHVFASVTCEHAGTMLPDYWSGHHLAHVAVPVDSGTTWDDLHNLILSELMDGCIMGSTPLAQLLSEENSAGHATHRDTERDLAVIAAHIAVLRDLKPNKPGGRPFPNLPSPDDDDADLFDSESAYAYFVFVQH